MPVIAPGDIVLVTGANGFVAVWLLKELLEHGYRVRGTVRTPEKGAYVLTLFKDAMDSGRFEVVVVPDFLAEGAFDEAVRGVHAIAHTATPVTLHADDPEELIRPSLEGTKSILKSALSHGKDLKRFIYTSSFASVIDSTKATRPEIIDESSWNESSYPEALREGRNASQMTKYRASKVAAERALWDFLETNKEVLAWDIVSLCPPLVIGGMLHELPESQKLNESNEMFMDLVFKKSPEEVKAFHMSYVDVRDVAVVHRLAFEIPEAANERFLIHAGQWTPQEWYDIINGLEIPGYTTYRGSLGSSFEYPYTVTNAKVREKLGMAFRERHDTAKALLEDLCARQIKLDG